MAVQTKGDHLPPSGIVLVSKVMVDLVSLLGNCQCVELHEKSPRV